MSEYGFHESWTNGSRIQSIPVAEHVCELLHPLLPILFEKSGFSFAVISLDACVKHLDTFLVFEYAFDL